MTPDSAEDVSSAPISRVGFIGLGDQGAPMAVALAEAGFTLHVWARRPESLRAVSAVSHVAHQSVESLARAADLVALCVGDDDDVDELLDEGGILHAMRPGTIVVNHSTGSPDACASFDERGRRAGVEVLDAPVSGGAARAVSRTLTVMVGGGAAAFQRARPVFEAYGKLIVHIGPAGSGQWAKLLNNVVYAANLGNVGDALRLAEDLDLDVALIASLIDSSSGSSFALQAVLQHIAPDQTTHAQRLVGKDIGHLARAAHARAVTSPRLEDAARRGVDVIPATVDLARRRPPEQNTNQRREIG